MKKIFTLFVVTMFAISMMASHLEKLPAQKQVSTNKELVVKTSAQQKALRAAMQDVTRRVARPASAQMTEPAFAAANKHVISAVQKVKAGTIDLNGGSFLVEPEYEAATGEWYIAVESNGYTFRLCWFAPENNYSGTFSYDDISWDWTWGWYQSAESFYEIYPSDITMTIVEKKVSDCLKEIILDATISDDANNRTYVLHIVHSAYSPKSTVENALTNTTLTITDGQYILDGNNNDIDVVLAVNSSTIEGAYTDANFDMNNTKVLYKGVEQKMLKADLVVYADYLANGALGYDATLSFYSQDTVLHVVSMPAPLPTPKDTISVECKNLVVDESYAPYDIIMLFGDNDLYDIFVMYEGTAAEPGVYNMVSVNISDKITWMTEASINATLTLSETEEGWKAHIDAYCTDYKWYSIDMKYEVPEPTDTVKIAFNESAIATYNQYDSHMLQLLVYGEEYEAGITIYGVKPGEEFTMDNVLLDYSGIYDWSVESSVRIADVKGKLLQSGDTTTITASVIGFNAVQYDLELWYTAPTPVDTIEIEMPIEFSNAMDFGYYTLSAYTPDSAWYISLSPLTNEVAGTFVNDGMFGKFGAEDGRYDFYAGSTFIYSEHEWKNYTVEKGSMVVEMAPDGTITAEANIICSNAVYYRIKMTSFYNTHLDFDEPDVAVDRTYTIADNVTIDDQTARYGYIYLALIAGDESDMAAFFFYVEESDEDIIVPEGIYPINYTEEYGTVAANPGVQGNGVWPSFYAQMLEDGSIVVPLWLMVDGTVEVRKDDAGNPHLEVNAYNSYGVPIHIVYDGSGTGLENVNVNVEGVKKQIIDGQLVIIRDGKAFNAMGAQVK